MNCVFLPRILLIIYLKPCLVIGVIFMYRLPSGMKPHGSIIVTASSDPTDALLDTISLGVDSHTVTLVGSDDGSHGVEYAYSLNGAHVAFLGMSTSSIKKAEDGTTSGGMAIQVYTAMATNTPPAPDNAHVVTQDPDMIKGVPSISNDGKYILYSSTNDTQRPGPQGTVGVANYSIHLVSVGTASTSTTATSSVLTTGMHPHWISDTVFCYIAVDGVRIWDVARSQSTLILPIPGQSNFKLSISPDAKILAFSNPDAQEVFVYSLRADGTIAAELGSIGILGFWVVFSPDSNFMAIQTAQQQSEQDFTDPSIEVYNTRTLKPINASILLKPLLNDSLFMTAWI